MPRTPTQTFLLMLLGLGLLSGPRALAGVLPSNDDFANRIVLTGLLDEHSGDNTDATRESGERTETGEHTVWFEWTAPQNGRLSVSNELSGDFPARIYAFVGTNLSNLRLAEGNSGNYIGRIPVAAGTTYFISLGGDEIDDNGAYTLRVTLSTTGSPEIHDLNLAGGASATNDLFDDRVVLAGENVSGIGYHHDAVNESGDQPTNGHHTMWWSWTAPSKGKTTFSIRHSDSTSASRKKINIYTGESRNTLRGVVFHEVYQRRLASTQSFPEVSILTEAGETYQIVVGELWVIDNDFSVVFTVSHFNPIPKARPRLSAVTGRNVLFGRRGLMMGTVDDPFVATSLRLSTRGNGRCVRLKYYRDQGVFYFRRRSDRIGLPYIIIRVHAYLDGKPNGFYKKRFRITGVRRRR